MSNATFPCDVFLKIIGNLNSEKVHGHNRISTRMLKICVPPMCKPLQTIFKSHLEGRFFHWHGKKQFHYFRYAGRYLSDCYVTVFFFFLITWFPRISQALNLETLAAISHGIHASFHEGYEVRGIFLDILKAFGQFSHEGLIFRLNQNGMFGRLTFRKRLPNR